MNVDEVPIEVARDAGPRPLCEDVARGFCAASVDGYCVGGYEVDGDEWLRCHG